MTVAGTTEGRKIGVWFASLVKQHRLDIHVLFVRHSCSKTLTLTACGSTDTIDRQYAKIVKHCPPKRKSTHALCVRRTCLHSTTRKACGTTDANNRRYAKLVKH